MAAILPEGSWIRPINHDPNHRPMARSKTSLGWLKRHVNDPYVKQAQKDGYRSRASYKLLEVQEKYKLIRPGMSVVDLGAAPGGWSQVTSRLIGGQGRLIASDILEMDSIPDVTFIQGDFTEDAVLAQILEAVGNSQVDLVISDMAPNMSGTPEVDMPKAMFLCELALDLAERILKPGGNFVIKIFQGEGFDVYLKDARKKFDKIQMIKPDSSRGSSREQYMLAWGYRGRSE
jgi:23S rRNA (uridine2552-2'-O)-methyltransferase